MFKKIRHSSGRSFPLPPPVRGPNTKSATTGQRAGRHALCGKTCQTACKPGSVHALRRETAIPLGRTSLHASRDQPGRRDGNVPVTAVARLTGRPYSVLLPMGFTLPPLLPGARCALTAPFHPCLRGRSRAGGLFSVALSLKSPSPAVSRHRIPVEPGLSSTRAQTPAAAVRPSGKPGFGRKPKPRQANSPTPNPQPPTPPRHARHNAAQR